MVTILIAPVGLYVGRVLRGIKEYRPHLIYFLLAEEEKETPQWYKETSENLKSLKEKLGVTYEGYINTIYVNFNDINDVFVKIHKIIEEETKNNPGDLEILLDITSTPLLPRMAFVNLAAIHSNVSVYYTPAKNKQPTHYDLTAVKGDEGKTPISIPTVRSKTYEELKKNEIYQKILSALSSSPESKVKSHAALMELIGFSKERKEYMYLGRILRVLINMGLVHTKPGEGREREVELTLLGEAIAKTFE